MSLMERRSIVALVFLLPLIFLAGCIGQQEKAITGQGVIIKEFGPDLSEIESEMPVALYLTVQNTGGKEAEDVKAELLGLPEGPPLQGLWDIEERREQKIGTGSLFSANPEFEQEGQEGFLTWTLTAPQKDVTVTYDFSVRVTYDYTTVSQNVIRIVSIDYYRSLPLKERETVGRGVITSASSAGPISITASAPQVLTTRERVAIPIYFEFTNVGGGRAYIGTEPTLKTLDYVEIDIEGARCDMNEVRLAKGETGKLHCDLPKEKVKNYEDFEVKLTASYSYFIEERSSITVLKELAY